MEDSLVDPLLSTTKDIEGLDKVADDPLMTSIGSEPTLANKRAKPAPKRKENWTSLIEIARLGRLDIFKSKKSLLRARLSALREDLEDDEAGTGRKVRDAKTRRWVLELLARDVHMCWEKGDRSRSLRAACLLAGALAVKDDAIDYAKEWVLVISALNKMCVNLRVHLQSAAQGEESSLGDTEDSARWNWYYKVGAIRGLVARLYLQATIWPLVGLDSVDEGGRLYTQSTGISDPVVRQYFVAYLISRGMVQDLDAVARDSLQSTKHASGTIEMLLPLSLTLCLCFKDVATAKESFGRFVGYAKSAVSLQAFLKVTEPEIVAESALNVLEAIATFPVGAPTLIAVIADKMLLSEPPVDELAAKTIMNTAWLILQGVETEDPEGALNCSAKFLELCCARYGAKEISVLTKDLERRIRESGGSKHNPSVMKACLALCGRVETEPSRLFPLVCSDAFARLFEGLAGSYDDSSFAHSSPKTDLAKRLLRLFLRTESKVELSAAVEWAKSLNDSLHVLSFEDERKQIDDLLRRFAEKAVNIASRLPMEARFALLVDLRGRFFNSELALKTLVSAVASLGREASISHSIKRLELCESCLSFCHASIPSIVSPVERGMYYSQAAVLAMSLGRLPQADGLFKACVQCVADCGGDESTSEARHLELVRTTASALVVAPGHPNAFYLVRGLANALGRRASWSDGRVFIAVLSLIEALTRVRLPYRVSGADSNDVLFGDDAAMYSNEAMSLAALQENKISTLNFKGELAECARLMQKIRENVKQRAQQVKAGTMSPE